MTSRFLVRACLGFGLCVVAAFGARAEQSPKPQVGTALIIGRVVDAGTGAPVDEAIVMLEPVAGRLEDRQSVMADAQGRFLFRDVPKGAFYVSADRTGFIRGGYGTPWPRLVLSMPEDRTARLLEVAENERITDLTIKLWKFASLSGRVVDQAGQPVVGATVRVMTKIVSGGRPALTFDTWECGGGCNHLKTDDRGVFRSGRMAPGDYVVVVPSVTSAAPTSLQRLIAAAATGETPPTFFRSGVAVNEWFGGYGSIWAGLRGPDDRMSITDVARSTRIAAFGEDGQLSLYPTHFYPSATRLSEATMIHLAPGEIRSDINFILRPARTVTVSGRLLGPDGPQADYVLRLVPMGQELLLSDPEVATAVSDNDGSFTFVGVTPGDYWIRLLNRPAPPNPDAAPVAAPIVRTKWAEARVSVGDTDATGVVVTLRDLARVSGRVEFVGNSIKPPARVPNPYIDRADGRRAFSSLFLTRADGQSGFFSDGQIPGTYLVQVPFPPAGWHLRSAMWNGHDVSDVPFDVTDSDVTGIVVTFADKPATVLAGTVQGSAGAPAASAVVLVFPVDAKRWIDIGRSPRRFAQTVSNARGAFTISNLPPGDYVVAALHGAEPMAWQDPAVLAKLTQDATKLSLVDAATANVNLRPIRWPR